MTWGSEWKRNSHFLWNMSSLNYSSCRGLPVQGCRLCGVVCYRAFKVKHVTSRLALWSMCCDWFARCQYTVDGWDGRLYLYTPSVAARRFVQADASFGCILPNAGALCDQGNQHFKKKYISFSRESFVRRAAEIWKEGTRQVAYSQDFVWDGRQPTATTTAIFCFGGRRDFCPWKRITSTYQLSKAAWPGICAMAWQQ